MTKFLLGTIATLLLTLSFFIYKHNRTLQDLEHEKYKNLSLESKLQDSNNALEKIQLDTQSYLKGRDKEIQVIQDKYTAILQDHKKALQSSSQVKLDNSHNATDTSKKSVSKENLHAENMQDIALSLQYNHNNTQQNFSYSENPNYSQNGKSYAKELQQCEAQIQTAKALLQSFYTK